MNKAELIHAAAMKADVSKKDAEAVLTAALDAIAEALAEGEIQCPNCGTRYSLDLSDDTVEADE